MRIAGHRRTASGKAAKRNNIMEKSMSNLRRFLSFQLCEQPEGVRRIQSLRIFIARDLPGAIKQGKNSSRPTS
jgi:hypothetical protein